jgi:hypothetical protein
MSIDRIIAVCALLGIGGSAALAQPAATLTSRGVLIPPGLGALTSLGRPTGGASSFYLYLGSPR